MKSVRISFLIIISFFLINVSFAQKEAFDAVYKKITREYTLEQNGEIEYHFYKEVRLNTYMSFHRLFGETFIIYNPDFQKLKINKCYTIMADGKRVEAPENAFNEVLPSFASKAPEYNNLREMVVTHTGLEIGATIFLDYTIVSDPGFMPALMGDEVLREDVPVESLEIIVNVPSGTTLHHKAIQSRIAPETSDDGTTATFKWNLTNILPDPAESMSVGEMIPRLVFSTFGDMQKAYFGFVNQPAFRHQTGSVVDKKVDAVKSGAKSEYDLILDLQEIAVDEVNHIEVPMKYTGYKVRSSEEIWQSTYGSSLERAIFLSDMLLKAGINAFPVVAIPEGMYDPSIGNILQFSRFYVQVNPKEYGQIYLSADRLNSRNEKYNLAGYVLIPMDAAIETMKTYKEKPLLDEMILHGDLEIKDTSTLTGNLQLKLSYGKNPYFKLLSDSSYNKRAFSTGIGASDIKKASLEKLSEAYSETRFEIEKRKATSKYGDYLFLDLPVLNDGFTSWRIGSLPWNRQESLQLPGLLKEEYELNIKIPSGWVLVTEPIKINLSNEAGKLEISLDYKAGQVIFVRKIEIQKTRFSPSELQQLRDLAEGWVNRNLERLVFKVE